MTDPSNTPVELARASLDAAHNALASVRDLAQTRANARASFDTAVRVAHELSALDDAGQLAAAKLSDAAWKIQALLGPINEIFDVATAAVHHSEIALAAINTPPLTVEEL